MLLGKSQIKCFPSLLNFIQVNVFCFVLFLFRRSLTQSVKSNKSINEIQWKKKSCLQRTSEYQRAIAWWRHHRQTGRTFICMCVSQLAVCRERAPRLLRPLRRAGRAEETQLQVGFTFLRFSISLRRLSVVWSRWSAKSHCFWSETERRSKALIFTLKNNKTTIIIIFIYLIFCTNIFPLAARRAQVVPNISVFKTTLILII